MIWKYLHKDGLEFPRPFEMKNLSRVALSCRNPLMTGILLSIISPLIYPHASGMTVSRLQVTVLFTLGTLTGVFFEQREVRKAMGEKQYKAYCSVIPNAIIPDLRVLLFKNEVEIDKMR
jgi:hypothetical protein